MLVEGHSVSAQGRNETRRDETKDGAALGGRCRSRLLAQTATRTSIILKPAPALPDECLFRAAAVPAPLVLLTHALSLLHRSSRALLFVFPHRYLLQGRDTPPASGRGSVIRTGLGQTSWLSQRKNFQTTRPRALPPREDDCGLVGRASSTRAGR